MKKQYYILLASVAAALGFWLMHAALDYLFSGQDSLWNLLILAVPLQDLYVRLLVLVLFLLWGVALAYIVARQDWAEATAHQHEALYHQLFHTSPVGTLLYDTDLRVTDCNQALIDFLASSRERIIGLDLNTLRDQSVLPALRAPLEGRSATFDGLYRATTSPAERWLLAQAFPLSGSDGGVQGGVALVQDVTVHRQVDERIHHLNAVLRAIRNVNQLITHVRDRDQLIRDACRELIETRGYYDVWIVLLDGSGSVTASAQAGLDDHFADFLEHLRDGLPVACIRRIMAQVDSTIARAEAFPDCQDCPLFPNHRDFGTLLGRLQYGDSVYGLVSVSLPGYLALEMEERDLFGEVVGDIAFALYSIEQEERRQRAEDAIVWEANLNAVLAELGRILISPHSIEEISNLVLENVRELTGSPDGYVGYVEQWSGRLICPAFAQNSAPVCPQEQYTSHPQSLEGLWGWVLTQRMPLMTNDPANDPRSTELPPSHLPIHRFLAVPVLADGRLIGQISLANASGDYTPREMDVVLRVADLYAMAIQRKRLEEQLLQAQKMEAVGRLAGGIAHDFNNHLTAITGYSELVLNELGDANPLRADVVQIHQAAARSASLTRQLLAFSRRQVLELQRLDLNLVVEGMVPMLRRLIREDVRLIVEPQPEPCEVDADPGQLAQMVMNLVVNARDALPEGGQIVIRIQHVSADERPMMHRDILPPDEYVALSVIDNGIGMDENTRAHLFEPFFTTKPTGKGTGLGLATVYGIVKQNGGYIFADSEPEHGSTFVVYLPRARRSAPASNEPAAAAAESLRGSETVLIVEDEDAVRILARRVLQRHGYTILEARDAVEALGLWSQYAERIHLLLADLVIPGGINGRALAERLQRECGALRVLYMSGYTEDIVAHHGVLEPGIHFIAKPFTSSGLARKVRHVLDVERCE